MSSSTGPCVWLRDLGWLGSDAVPVPV